MTTYDSYPDLLNNTAPQVEIENDIKFTLNSSSIGDVLDVGQLVLEDWDTLYVFGENTSYKYINKTMGIKWLPDKDFYLEDIVDLLVFVKDKQVIEYVSVHGDLFKITTGSNKYLRAEAKFIVREVDDPIRPKLLFPAK